MYEREKFTVDGLTVRIIHDEDAENPRKEWDHAGTMACWHRRYDLGDARPDCSPDEFFLRLMHDRESTLGRSVPDELNPDNIRQYIDKHYHVLPLYLLDHSGLSISTGGYRIADADGHELDSCWGFYGSDHCKEQATESAQAIASRLASDFAI
jgi:hypothetical protein